MPTPVKELTVGFAWDYVNVGASGAAAGAWANTLGTYVSYQTTEKLKLNARVDLAHSSAGVLYGGAAHNSDDLLAVTLTADSNLWQNVVSRVELRWDKTIGGDAPFGATTAIQPPLTAALNLIPNY